MNKYKTESYIQQTQRNGIWTFRVRCKGLDRSFVESDYLSVAQAFQAAKDFRNNILVGNKAIAKNGVTVEECYQHIGDIYSLRSESIRKYDCIFRKYITHHKDQISSITRADIMADINACVDTCSDDTILRVLVVWRKICTYAVAKDYIFRDLTENIQLPKSRRIKSVPRNELTNEQTLMTIADELSTRLKTPLQRYQARYILLTFLYTGLRPTELFALNVEDVDLKKKTISVTKELEGNRDNKNTVRPTKTDESYRTVPMPDKLVKVLKDYVPHGSIYFGNGDKYYFVNDIGNCYHRIAKKIGIDFHFYQCRHTYITNLYNAGASIKNIQKLVGQNVDLTTYGYIIVDNDKLKNAVNML